MATNELRNVTAVLGQVRKVEREKLAHLRAARKQADALTDVKQSAAVGKAVLDMTAKSAATVKATVDIQEKAQAASVKIYEQGAKPAADSGKTRYVLTLCDVTGAPVEGADALTMTAADGRAVWTLLSGAKGFLVPEQVEMLDERTEGFIGEMQPSDVYKLEKIGENNTYTKLIRCGGFDGDDNRYWEVIKPAESRTVNREFIRVATSDTPVTVPENVGAARYPVMSREKAWEIAMKEVTEKNMEAAEAAKWVTERCDELQCI